MKTSCIRKLGLLSAMLFGMSNTQAQGLGEALLEEIIVTATKRAGGTNVQETPIAITAYNASQLDAMHLRDLKALGYSAPSVQLEDVGTTRGTANFSIRGLGINSSIPSIDPTVGVFVDGMYYGLTAGVVLDTFDLESVEVLRGPQGLLFGRNVTGGAVLMNTTRPTDEFRINARAAYETGDNSYLSAVLTGPLSDRIGWKFAAYNNEDGGWHTNLFNGNDSFGKASTTVLRGALEFELADNVDLIVRAEHGDSDGDGPAAQQGGCQALQVPGLCLGPYPHDSFDFGIDEEGFYDNTWDNLIAEINWDVGFGDGTITNILGYRKYESNTLGDIDSTPAFIFHAPAITNQDQVSNELRYSGSWDNVYLTTGVYYFTQEIEYIENRLLPASGFPPPGITGGGNQDQTTYGLFAQFDIQASDEVTFNIGGRWTKEKKDAQVATIPLNICTFPAGCTTFDFTDSRDWDNFTPKLGVQVMPNDDTQFYAFWTKGFRSGGYNLRHTAVAIPNAPFDEEEQTSLEFGLKQDFAGGRIRSNLALYRNSIENMQRELNLADPVVGVVQLIRNTADAVITGIDLEVSASVTDSLFVRAFLGYVDGEYTEVLFDLNGDAVIDEADLALEIPRLAPWSYGGEVVFETELSWATFTAQASAAHRDAAFYTDNNLGKLRSADMIDAQLALAFMDGQLSVSAFGRNLKDEVTIGGDTQLPIFPGSTFSPLNKGTTYGLEVRYNTN